MLNALSGIARTAGKMMLDYQNAAIHQKEGHYNFVTDADVAVQEYIQGALSALRPDAAFIGEEQDNARLTDAPAFIVDPIDGTLNFMRCRHMSAVSIGYLEGKQPLLGVIYNPYLDEMYTAERGKGAHCNHRAIHVSETPIENAMIALGTSPYDQELVKKTLRAAQEFLLRAGDLRRTGSAAIDLCDVACGRIDAFYELRLRPWDVAAGALLVSEAGGVFCSLGHDAPYFEDACGIVASNRRCAEEALRIVQEAAKC